MMVPDVVVHVRIILPLFSSIVPEVGACFATTSSIAESALMSPATVTEAKLLVNGILRYVMLQLSTIAKFSVSLETVRVTPRVSESMTLNALLAIINKYRD